MTMLTRKKCSLQCQELQGWLARRTASRLWLAWLLCTSAKHVLCWTMCSSYCYRLLWSFAPFRCVLVHVLQSHHCHGAFIIGSCIISEGKLIELEFATSPERLAEVKNVSMMCNTSRNITECESGWALVDCILHSFVSQPLNTSVPPADC